MDAVSCASAAIQNICDAIRDATPKLQILGGMLPDELCDDFQQVFSATGTLAVHWEQWLQQQLAQQAVADILTEMVNSPDFHVQDADLPMAPADADAEAAAALVQAFAAAGDNIQDVSETEDEGIWSGAAGIALHAPAPAPPPPTRKRGRPKGQTGGSVIAPPPPLEGIVYTQTQTPFTEAERAEIDAIPTLLPANARLIWRVNPELVRVAGHKTCSRYNPALTDIRCAPFVRVDKDAAGDIHVYATQAIAKGADLGRYEGEQVPKSHTLYGWHRYIVGCTSTHSVVGDPKAWTSHINDVAAAANVELCVARTSEPLVEQRTYKIHKTMQWPSVRSTRDIGVGEELVLDAGDAYRTNACDRVIRFQEACASARDTDSLMRSFGIQTEHQIEDWLRFLPPRLRRKGLHYC